jgi:hypothetical protein
VSKRFALLQLNALHLERAWLSAKRAKPSAVGTGLLLAQGVGLLFEESLQGTLGEASGGGEGDLLQSRQIDIESGALVAEGASGDNFAPLGSEAAEFLDFVRGKGAVCHDASCVGVRTRTREKVARVRLARRT